MIALFFGTMWVSCVPQPCWELEWRAAQAACLPLLRRLYHLTCTKGPVQLVVNVLSAGGQMTSIALLRI